MASGDIKILRENSGGNYDEITPAGLGLWHGIEACGARTFTDATHVLSLASVTYWYKGVRYTTASAVTCDIDDYCTLATNKLYFFYFDAAAGTLKCRDTVWDFYENVFVCTVFWNGSTSAPQKEIHDYRRNIPTHIWAHDTIGCRYESGSGLTNPTTVNDALLQIETGTYHDEDMEIITGQCTTMRGWYQASANVYTFANYSLPYLGTSGQPQYLRTTDYTLQNVPGANFACYWVYASGDDARPIYIVPTHATASYSTLALARAETAPTLSGLNFNSELKLIYRFIYKGDGNFQESADYRLSAPLPSGGLTNPNAGSVSFTPSGNISSTSVQAAIEELDTEKQASGNYPTSAEITIIKKLSAAEYAALNPKVSTTLYIIVG